MTRALLTAEAIKAHLHHFCNTLPKQSFVVTDPTFSIQELGLVDGTEMLTARVTLPNCVGSFARSYPAAGKYRTEIAAYRDAAYQCYKALYTIELVNKNLLPGIPNMQRRFQDLPSTIEVDDRMQPWKRLAGLWSSSEVHKTTIKLETDRLDDLATFSISIITPMRIPTTIPVVSLPTSKQHTDVRLKHASVSDSKKVAINTEQLDMLRQRMARFCISSETQHGETVKDDFVYIFDFDEGHELLSNLAPIDIYHVMTQVVGLVENVMVASSLQESVFPKCALHDVAHAIIALTAPSADAQSTFERYEFFGDAILKVVVATQMFTDHVSWPAGWLSQCKDNLVSNASLANAALSLRLDRYILTKAFTTTEGVLPRMSDAACLPEKRTLSTKTMADVSQALFAAAYLDSGYDLARSCIKVFVPEIRSDHASFDMPRGVKPSGPDADEVQELIGHRFRNTTILLQALTHPSCASNDSEESYQRLAFLGDAVLGFLVAKMLFQHHEKLSEGRMTEIRAAAVNSNMLGYICMTHSISREMFNIETVSLTVTPKEFREVRHVDNMSLWKYMRYESKDLGEALEACSARYHSLSGKLQQQIHDGCPYPWVTLAELQPEGFYSDVVQSTIGAIYVDSGEDWDACQRFVEKVGICAHIQRMLQPGYDVTHPRSALQQLNPLAELKSECMGDGSFNCKVLEGEDEITRAEGCKSKSEALLEASHRAVQILGRREGGTAARG